MYSAVVVVLLMVTFSVTVNSEKLHTEDVTLQKKIWEDYKKDFKKSFASKEIETVHFNRFVKRLQHIDRWNEQTAAQGGHDPAKFGLTKFADEDVSALFPPAAPGPAKLDTKQNSSMRRLTQCGNNKAKNWASDNLNKVTPVKDQEGCHGGHWAFAVAEQVESEARIASNNGFTDILSPQQLIDCTDNFFCTDQSLDNAMLNAFTYLKNDAGLQSNSNYPYSSVDGSYGPCSVSTNDEKVKVTSIDHTSLVGDECALIGHILYNGPVAVCLSVGANFFSYSGGVLDAAACALPDDNGDTNTYMVCGQLTKVREKNSEPEKNKYKFRASFGAGFGKSGYVKMHLYENVCGVTDKPIVIEVQVL